MKREQRGAVPHEEGGRATRPLRHKRAATLVGGPLRRARAVGDLMLASPGLERVSRSRVGFTYGRRIVSRESSPFAADQGRVPR